MNIESDIREYAIDKLKDGIGVNEYAADLHHYLFNEDYFIIGIYEAKKWLSENPGTFEAIEVIKEYEQMNFGEVNTDFSNPESVVNMYAYIVGEEIVQDYINSLDSKVA